MPEPAISAVLGLWQDRPANENLDVAANVAELGYERLWIGEMATYDAFALATAIGLRAPSLHLTIGPLAVSVRTPTTIAMGVGSVADLTGARVSVALGSSSKVVAEQWHGRPRHRPARSLEDATVIVRGLLDGEKVDHVGPSLSSRGYHLRVPAPGADITVAAFGDRAVRVAAAHADRMVLNMVTATTLARYREQVDRHAAEAGRQPPRLAVWVGTAVDPTEGTINQLLSAKVGYLSAPGYAEMFTEAGFGDVVALARGGAHPRDILAALPPEVEAVIGAVGDTGTVRRRIRAYHDAGADEVCIVPATAGDPGALRTLTALAPTVATTEE